MCKHRRSQCLVIIIQTTGELPLTRSRCRPTPRTDSEDHRSDSYRRYCFTKWPLVSRLAALAGVTLSVSMFTYNLTARQCRFDIASNLAASVAVDGWLTVQPAH